MHSLSLSLSLSLSEMRPALPTASSNVTPYDSPPTIDRGSPTEMISDSSSASVPSSSTRLLTPPLLKTASRTMGDNGGTDLKGHNNIQGRNPPHDDYSRLPQQLDSYSFSSSHQA